MRKRIYRRERNCYILKKKGLSEEKNVFIMGFLLREAAASNIILGNDLKIRKNDRKIVFFICLGSTWAAEPVPPTPHIIYSPWWQPDQEPFHSSPATSRRILLFMNLFKTRVTSIKNVCYLWFWCTHGGGGSSKKISITPSLNPFLSSCTNAIFFTVLKVEGGQQLNVYKLWSLYTGNIVKIVQLFCFHKHFSLIALDFKQTASDSFY